MPPDDPSGTEEPTPAELIFARHVLEPRARGELVDFKELVLRYPDLRVALEALESNDRAAREAAQEVSSTGEASADRPWRLREGDLLGDFEIIGPLGRGGFGQVYRAHQLESIRRHVALKLLSDEDPKATERFAREIDTLGQLNHPSIAKVFDAGSDPVNGSGRPVQFFTMELIEGEPIDAYCDSMKLNVDERLDLFLRVCEAVSHAHRSDVVHRDLKPSNILVQTDVTPAVAKIIDFGLVRALGGAQGSAFTRAATGGVGTLTHMAPEQALLSKDVGAQADVYSLGVVLYELLTGRLPIDPAASKSTGDLIHRLRTERPTAPSARVASDPDAVSIAARRSAQKSELPRELRGNLDAILTKALAKQPGDRYTFVADLAEDIRRHRADEPVLAAPASWSGALARTIRRHRAGIVIAAAISVLVGVPAALWLRGAIQRRELLEAAESAYVKFDTLAARARALHGEWTELVESTPPWAPFWERTKEIERWRELSQISREISSVHPLTRNALWRAMDGLDGAELERARGWLASTRRIHEAGAPSMLEILELATPLDEDAAGDRDGATWRQDTISIDSEPSGAELLCFRYRHIEGRQVPLPFDPRVVTDDLASGFVGEERLVVDRVWWTDGDSAARPPFESGDELLEVNAQRSRTHGELARAIAQVPAGDTVTARIRRANEELEVSWRVWERSVPREVASANSTSEEKREKLTGRMVQPSWQLHVSFESAPLDLDRAPVIGRTTGTGTQISLPWGSYLLVLRRDGHEPMRVPVRVSGQREQLVVQLPASGSIPPGFVPIPGGRSALGRDRRAFQPFPSGEKSIEPFAIGRFEITGAEWLEFLNHAHVRDLLDAQGRSTTPLCPAVREALGRRPLQLAPSYQDRLHAERVDGLWVFRDPVNLTRAARYVSHLAAREYAYWRSLVARDRDEPWEFRLPTDEEWERAARGADGRLFPWGNYLLWSACVSRRGSVVSELWPGWNSLDESPFGVRDLCGSVQEHTLGQPVTHLPNFRTVRGGSYYEATDEYFRLASRNTVLESTWKPAAGLRLVAVRRESSERE